MSTKNNRTLIDVVHPVAAGIDIASKQMDVTIIKHRDVSTEPELIYQQFGTSTCQLYALRDFLIQNECLWVCMESTGIYWTALYSILEEKMQEVRVVHAKYVKAIKNRKDDRRDSEWIAHQYRLGLTEGSYIPARDVRDCRQLTRYRKKLSQQRATFTNRRLKILRKNNITLDTVLEDINGKTGRALVDLIVLCALEGRDPEAEEILVRIDPRCKKDRQLFIKACQGIRFSESDIEIVRSINRNIDHITHEMQRITSQINKVIARSASSQLRLLTSIPGVGPQSAQVILAEIGFDLSYFPSAKRLVSWTGLCPACNKSGGKAISVHIAKSGKNLKPVLVQCAHSAVKSSPYYSDKFKAISSRQGKKRAYIAIARKLVVAIWFMLVKQEKWNPSDRETASGPVKKLKRKAEKAIKKAISDSLNLGIEKEELAVSFVTYLNEAENNNEDTIP